MLIEDMMKRYICGSFHSGILSSGETLVQLKIDVNINDWIFAYLSFNHIESNLINTVKLKYILQ